MRLRTGHQRRKHHLFGPQFPAAALRRFALCNRFAASDAGKDTRVWDKKDYRSVTYFPAAFYDLKDRILARYGRLTGYALQYWESGWEDWDDGEFYKDACGHHHILKCVRLAGRTYHVPTGEFRFANYVNGGGKCSRLYEVYFPLCKQRIEGKKRITQNVPDKHTAFAAYKWLWKRYGHLPAAPTTPRHEIVGTPEHAAYLAWQCEQENRQRQREAERQEAITRRQAERAAQRICCRWCKQVKTGLDFGKSDYENICDTCDALIDGQKAAKVGAAYTGVPF